VLVPRRFRPGELPGWLRRAVDPGSRWRFDSRALLPRVTLYLHLAEETLRAHRQGSPHGAVRPEGDVPVTLQYLYDQVLPYQAVRVTPVLDLAGQEPVDGYEIPRRHRRAVRLRTPADCFPFAANLDPVEIDHTEAYRHPPGPDGRVPPGQSRMDNYGPLGRHHHRVKTHGGWQVKQPFAGIYVWRDPVGHFFLVDHTGTRKITPPRPPTRPRAGPRPVVVEIYRHSPHIDLDLAA
jgi:hypothetical protein